MRTQMTIRACVLAAGSVFALGSAAVFADDHGDAHHYALDTVHSKIFFFADHLGFSKSGGEFRDFDGSFHFDADDWSTARVEITVESASLDMGDQAWNDHMHNEDFFHVEQFPQAHFVGDRLEQTGENTGQLHGALTLLGQTHPVVLDVTLNGVGEHPMNDNVIAGFSATANISRSQWGMTYGVPAIGDDVELRFEIEGVRQ